MRISELLSLDQEQVDFCAREAKIIGKGGKERVDSSRSVPPPG